MELRNKGMSAVDLVYFAIIVIVGIQVFSGFSTVADTVTVSSSTAAYAASKGNVTANTYGGFQTISTGPTIIAAVIILGIVGMLMSRR